ncbi:hypothetical protein ACFQQB_39265 [Nonomuraea rubra]|uniref:hypothetical protein n=1 Tax=Nonomuraea rubra TaxID=46180 RepID=UPI003611BF01
MRSRAASSACVRGSTSSGHHWAGGSRRWRAAVARTAVARTAQARKPAEVRPGAIPAQSSRGTAPYPKAPVMRPTRAAGRSGYQEETTSPQTP